MTSRSPPIAAFHASSSESFPSVAEMSVRSSDFELHRQRAGLEHDRDVLRLVDPLEPLDLRAAAADAAGERRVRVVDLREGADLAVEDDREVLRLRCGTCRGSTRRA